MPGKHHPPPQHHHPHHHDEFLDTLGILIDEECVNTAEEMIACAERHHEPEVVEFLRGHAGEVSEVGLLLRALAIHLEIEAHRQHKNRLGDWQSRRVALIFPLPPHVHEPLMELPQATILVPRGHHLPPHLRHRLNSAVVQDSRACRQVIACADAIVFEAHRSNGNYYVDDGIADILDLRIVPATAQVVVHLRPHPHPDDVDFDFGSTKPTLL